MDCFVTSALGSARGTYMSQRRSTGVGTGRWTVPMQETVSDRAGVAGCGDHRWTVPTQETCRRHPLHTSRCPSSLHRGCLLSAVVRRVTEWLGCSASLPISGFQPAPSLLLLECPRLRSATRSTERIHIVPPTAPPPRSVVSHNAGPHACGRLAWRLAHSTPRNLEEPSYS